MDFVYIYTFYKHMANEYQ